VSSRDLRVNRLRIFLAGCFGIARAPSLLLAADLIVAGFAARIAVVQAVFAEANINLRLAGAAILFAFAAFFGHFALHADVFFASSRVSHGSNLAQGARPAKFRWGSVLTLRW